MIPLVIFPSIIPSDDGLAGSPITTDHVRELPWFRGNSSAESTSASIGIGVNDEDTVKILIHSAVITEGSALSIHLEDDSTSYQNTSGADAAAVIIISAVTSGAQTRHIKVWSGPTENSTTSATLEFEIGSAAGFWLNAAGESVTVGPIIIQNNHYITLENVDDSRAGTNNISVTLGAFVVERG